MSFSLKIDGVRLLSVECRIINHHKPQTWRRAIAFSLWAQRHSPWWIGDMLLAGSDRFGDEFCQYLPAGSELSFDAMERFRAVAAKVPACNRNDNLSWSHHTAVANAPRELQRKLLAVAEQDGMSSFEFAKFCRQFRKTNSEWRRRNENSG